MSWAVVARKDFEDAVRAKTLWVLVGLFAAAMALSTWYFGDVAAPANASVPPEALIVSLVLPTSFVLPAMGIMVGYKAISGERNSGSIKLLLSLPHSRSDVLLGKFLGRTGVVAAAVLLGSLVGAISFAVFADSFAFVQYLQFLFLTLALGTAFVSIAVGFSASTKSGTLAIVGGIALVLLFTLLWDLLTFLLLFVLNESLNLAQSTTQDVLGVVSATNPTNAYQRLIQTVLDLNGAEQFAADGFYGEPWFAVVVLLAWLVVPLGFGYWRFERAELG